MTKKKKKTPKLPDINSAFLRYRNDAQKYYKKYLESLIAMNNLLPEEYRIDFKTWLNNMLEEIEGQFTKYRDDNWKKE